MGFVALDHGLWDSWPWRIPAKQFKIFVWLIHRARWAHKPSRLKVAGQWVTVRRGQLWTSMEAIAIECDVSRGTVYRAIRTFEEDGFIKRQNLKHRGTIITVCNYDAYQSPPDERGTTNGTTDGTTDGTHKNQVTKKPEKQKTKGQQQFFAESEDVRWMRENLYGLDDQKLAASYLMSCYASWDSVARAKRIDLREELLKASAYAVTKPGKYKDFPAYYRNWINRAQGQPKDPYHKDEPANWTMKIDGVGYFGGHQSAARRRREEIDEP